MRSTVQCEGRATVLGDDIDTDIIFPARYLGAAVGVTAWHRGQAQIAEIQATVE